MAITITHGTRGSETQEEAAKRFWASSCKYADELFAEKAKRDRGVDMEREFNATHG